MGIIKDFFKPKENKTIDVLLIILKVFIFGVLVAIAGVMYGGGNYLIGNDLLLTAAVLLILNKLEKR